MKSCKHKKYLTFYLQTCRLYYCLKCGVVDLIEVTGISLCSTKDLYFRIPLYFPMRQPFKASFMTEMFWTMRRYDVS
jgi:hypothetical protein